MALLGSAATVRFVSWPSLLLPDENPSQFNFAQMYAGSVNSQCNIPFVAVLHHTAMKEHRSVYVRRE